MTWTLDHVQSTLAETMRRAYNAVAALADERGLDLRTAAYIMAIGRVGRAAVLQGL